MITDFNPGRCPYTWTPEPHAGISFPSVRCTHPINHPDGHKWERDKQEEWVEQTKFVLEQVIPEARTTSSNPARSTGGQLTERKLS